LFVLGVGKEHKNLILFDSVVDHPHSTTLPSSLCRPSNLAEATSAPDEIARVWLNGQGNLKLAILRIIEQVCDLLGENRRLDEFHIRHHTSLTHGGKFILLPTARGQPPGAARAGLVFSISC
jgi:hypothetical protein